jgi:hypothetical protein
MPTLHQQKDFLEKDLYDALRWLFIGAVAWQAAREQPGRWGRQYVLGMLTSFVQARSLYEFFFSGSIKGDDARACHFAPSWKEVPETRLYQKYMAAGMPANKRAFHLVYDRGRHSGGTGEHGPDHIIEQVFSVAKELRQLTEEFIQRAEQVFREEAQSALQKALNEAEGEANYYGIKNPFADV